MVVQLAEATPLTKFAIPLPASIRHINWDISSTFALMLGPFWLELAQVLCMLSRSLWVRVCSCHAVSRKHWSRPPLLVLMIFLYPFHWSFLNCGDGGVWYALHHLLFSAYCLFESLCIDYYDEDLRDTLFYGYGNKSLGLILILFPFTWITILVSPLGLWPILMVIGHLFSSKKHVGNALLLRKEKSVVGAKKVPEGMYTVWHSYSHLKGLVP